MKHIRKKYLRLFFYVACLPGMYSCNSNEELIQPAVESITEAVYASGVVKSKNQYQVFAKVPGIIDVLYVKEGDEIRQGQPILRLSNDAIRLGAESARISADYANVSANTEKIRELQLNIDLAASVMQNDSLLLERQKNLWQQQIGSLNDLERRQLAYQNSVASWKAAKLRLQDVQKQLKLSESQSRKNLQISTVNVNDFTIKSETAGKVYSLLKEKGEMVNTQSPIAIIGEADAFIIELQVDEYDIAKIRIGQQVILTLDSYKGKTFAAGITRISPIMNERTRSFLVEAEFANEQPVLYPNLTVEANIVLEVRDKVITIPRNYLLNDTTVLLSGKIPRYIKTGLSDYTKVEITAGLQAEDWIMKPVQ